MKTYETILVAVDGSDESKKAFSRAIDITKKEKAKLIITHIYDTRYLVSIEHYENSLLDSAEKYGEDLLAEFKNEAVSKGVEDVIVVLEFGSPKVKIPRDIVNKYDVDLVVTGAHGLNAVERILIGSVSEAITRHSKCDVLIVRN